MQPTKGNVRRRNGRKETKSKEEREEESPITLLRAAPSWYWPHWTLRGIFPSVEWSLKSSKGRRWVRGSVCIRGTTLRTIVFRACENRLLPSHVPDRGWMPWHRERSSFSLYDVVVRRGRGRRGERRGREKERERVDNQRSLSRGRELEKLREILRTEWDKGRERQREREEKKNFHGKQPRRKQSWLHENVRWFDYSECTYARRRARFALYSPYNSISLK